MSVERLTVPDDQATVVRHGEGPAFPNLRRNVVPELATRAGDAAKVDKFRRLSFGQVLKYAIAGLIILILVSHLLGQTKTVSDVFFGLLAFGWNILFFGIFAWILFKNAARKMKPSKIAELRQHLDQARKSMKPPRYNS